MADGARKVRGQVPRSISALQLTETPGGLGFAIGQRTIGHGNWSQKSRRTYRQKFIALLNFDTPANLPGTPGFDPATPVSPGFFAGWQTVTQTLELIDGNNAASEGTNAFYKTDGTVYRTGCSSAVAERFRYLSPTVVPAVSGRHRMSLGQRSLQVARVAALAAVVSVEGLIHDSAASASSTRLRPSARGTG